ncbi:MAG: tRNA (guanosine(46)-N7)-methyltransferase TrmB [Prevotella sp.]|nr:tRNA (guanosine(46)-N7)-methyltransferase TrmB [Prevotella sp.]
MGKGKLAKFADMETYRNVFQYPYSVVSDVPFAMQGHWREEYFHNDNPIILELGCGKGEYAVELAKAHPDCNYIGVDIKGARMWTGATQALQQGIGNVAFLRTNIEIIDRFFDNDEVQQIWLTFSDPQMKNPRKRLTSTYFLKRYRHFLEDRGIIHLKTDSNFLFTYTSCMVNHNQLPLVALTDDLYTACPQTASSDNDPALAVAASIQTYYEKMWLSRGLSIKYMQFLLPQEGELQEPDVEIELDDYRSYHRSKRSSLETSK